MNKTLTRILGLVAAFVVLYAGLGLVSSASQIAGVFDQFSPGLGRPVFIAICVILLVVGITPVVLFYRLPKPLIPPPVESGPAFDAYLGALRGRLKRNKHLSGEPLETQAQLEIALGKLGAKADALVKQHASSVFVSTAVMQNGRLDGLIVLFTQLRMIWLIADIFFQRPSPRQMLYLYGNVGTNVVLAQNIQEIEVTELATPIVMSIFPSLNGAIPGMQGITNLILNSLANGSANAFLTLRVGIIARMYCESLCTPQGKAVRTGATRKALELLGTITKENGNVIARRALDMVSNKFGAMVKGAAAAGDAIVGGAAAAGGAVVGGVSAVGGAIAGGVSAAGGAIAGGVSAAGGAVVGGVTAAGGAIAGGASVAGGAIAGGATAIGGKLAGGVSAAGDAIKKGARGVKNKLSNSDER